MSSEDFNKILYVLVSHELILKTNQDVEKTLTPAQNEDLFAPDVVENEVVIQGDSEEVKSSDDQNDEEELMTQKELDAIKKQLDSMV